MGYLHRSLNITNMPGSRVLLRRSDLWPFLIVHTGRTESLDFRALSQTARTGSVRRCDGVQQETDKGG